MRPVMAGIFEAHCSPTADENSFCSSSSDQGALLSLSTSTLSGKMPKNCTGSHSGQDHCLCNAGARMSNLPVPPIMMQCTQPCGASHTTLRQAASPEMAPACLLTLFTLCRRGGSPRRHMNLRRGEAPRKGPYEQLVLHSKCGQHYVLHRAAQLLHQSNALPAQHPASQRASALCDIASLPKP